MRSSSARAAGGVVERTRHSTGRAGARDDRAARPRRPGGRRAAPARCGPTASSTIAASGGIVRRRRSAAARSSARARSAAEPAVGAAAMPYHRAPARRPVGRRHRSCLAPLAAPPARCTSPAPVPRPRAPRWPSRVSATKLFGSRPTQPCEALTGHQRSCAHTSVQKTRLRRVVLLEVDALDQAGRNARAAQEGGEGALDADALAFAAADDVEGQALARLVPDASWSRVTWRIVRIRSPLPSVPSRGLTLVSRKSRTRMERD